MTWERRKVRRVTIVSTEGYNVYQLGQDLHGNIVHEISQYYETDKQGNKIMYIEGYRSDAKILFHLINVPVDIEYLVT